MQQLQSSSRIVERKERKVDLEAEASPNLQVAVGRRHRRDQVVEIDSSRPAAGSWSSRKIDWSRRVVIVLTSTSTAKKSIGLTYSCTSTTQYFHCKLAQPPPGWRPPTRGTPCEHRQRALRPMHHSIRPCSYVYGCSE